MNIILLTILLSASPIAEVRLGIPFAISLGMNPITAFIIGVSANIAVIPIVFLFLNYLHKYFMLIYPYKKLYNIYIMRAREKLEDKLSKKGEFVALFFLVALPIPGTGAYTASLAAFLFGLKKTKAIPTIALGVIASGLLITLISTGILTVMS